MGVLRCFIDVWILTFSGFRQLKKYPGDVPNPCATRGQNSWKDFFGIVALQGHIFAASATWEARKLRGSQDVDRWTRA